MPHERRRSDRAVCLDESVVGKEARVTLGHSEMLSSRKRVILSLLAGVLLLADVAEARQHLAIDRLLVFEYGQGAEWNAPLLELQQRDCGIARL